MNSPPMDQPPMQTITTDAYLAAMAAIPSPSIANATPSYGSAPVHPPYSEMIMAAITALNEKDGSSKKAIAKFIEGAYPNLPPSHPALLTHHLKRLKNSAQLAMVKKSYILPPPPGTRSDLPSPLAADFAFPTSLKRRPGRPPKQKSASFEPISTASLGISFPPPSGLDDAGAVSVKRRGRPPKPKPAPSAFDYHQDQPLLQQQQQPQQVVYAAEPLGSHNPALFNSGLVNGTTAPLLKRRGRPPKYLAHSVGDRASEGAAVPALVKRKAGRPPKSAGGGRPRGRPRKTDPFAAPVSQAPAAGGSRRGRPRKRPLAVDAPNVATVGMKRRGRPSKLSLLRVGRSGRPVGRPRKNASTVGAHPSGESEVAASVELTRKLEYMQLKVKRAVGLLKPHLINANIIDILTAIQDLEELAAMDISASATTEIATAPMVEVEPIAPTVAHATAPPTEMAAPLLDLSAPAYPDPGVVGHLPMTFN